MGQLTPPCRLAKDSEGKTVNDGATGLPTLAQALPALGQLGPRTGRERDAPGGPLSSLCAAWLRLR